MPAPNTVACPHCGIETVILPGTSTRRWLCDVCGGLIDLRADGEPPAPAAVPSPRNKTHASKWMDGFTPEQQQAIREELAANPELMRKELARVRRETTARVFKAGARSPLVRFLAGLQIVGGSIMASQPISAYLLGRLGTDIDLPEATAIVQSSPFAGLSAVVIGIGLIVCGAALAFGRRWGAHGTAILLVIACFLFQFHWGVVTHALGMITALFLVRKALE